MNGSTHGKGYERPLSRTNTTAIFYLLLGLVLLSFATVVLAQPIQIVPRWLNPVSESPHIKSTAVASLVDGSGNVYVAGNVDRREGAFLPIQSDIYVALYGEDGSLLGSYSFGASLGYGNDTVTGLEFTRDGNLLVVGSSEEIDGSLSLIAIGLDTSLVEQWQARYSPPNMGLSFGRDIRPAAHALSYNDGFYVAGWSGSSKSGETITLLSYSNTGELRSATEHLMQDYTPKDAVIGPRGSLAVIGANNGISIERFGPPKGSSWYIPQIDYGIPTRPEYPFGPKPKSIIINADASYYLLGHASDNNGETDTLVTKVSASGEVLWKHFGGSGRDKPIKIVSNRNSEAFVLVQHGARNAASGPTAVVTSYDAHNDVEVESTLVLSDELVSGTSPLDLFVDEHNRLIVAGHAKPLCGDQSQLVCDKQAAFVTLIDPTSSEQWYYLKQLDGEALNLNASEQYVVASGMVAERGFSALFPVTPTLLDYKGFKDAGQDIPLPDPTTLPFPIKH